jgi:hypothetical protein
MTTITKMIDRVVVPYTEEDYAQLEKDKAELAQLQQQSIPTKEELMAELAALTAKINALG